MALRIDTPVAPTSDVSAPAADQQQAILVAQAGQPDASGQPQAAEVVIEVSEGSVLRLPEGASIDQPRMNGTNLEFVQPDGSVIVVPNGAVQGLTIFIGGIEIPPIAVAALFEESNIQTAAGPEGNSVSSSGGNFERPVGDIGDAFQYGGLLDDSAAAGIGDGNGVQAGDANLAPILDDEIYEVRLTEEALENGFPDDLGTFDFSSVRQFSGSLGAVDPNNDAMSFTFGTPSTAFTSGGVAVTWTGAGTGTLTGWAGDVMVFEATFTGPAGEYTITLYKPIDHTGAGEGELAINLPITVTDVPGGMSTPATIRLIIEDDSPVVRLAPDAGEGATRLSISVDETVGAERAAQGETANGNSDDAEGVLGRTTSNFAGGLADLFTLTGGYGADGAAATNPLVISFSFTGIPAGGLASNLSATDGGLITLFLEGGAIVGRDAGNAIAFRLEIVGAPGAEQIETTLFKAISHGSSEQFDETAFLRVLQGAVQLRMDVTATDFDGDSTSTFATIDLANGVSSVVGFEDDGPTSMGVVTSSTVVDDEAQALFPGNNTPSDGIANVATASGAAGSLFSMGSDGLGSVTITPPGFSVVSKDAQGFAQTEAVSWGAGVRGADGTTTWTATSTNHAPAATLIIKADGSYSFTLNAPLAHSGSGETNNELSFGFSVTDGDGDKVTGTLKVNVNDDAPNAVNTVNASRTLDDEAQTEFTPTNTGWTLGDTNPNYKSVSGGAGTLFSMGSDGLGSITVTPPAFSVIYKDTQGFAQTEAVTWDGGVRSADGTTTWTATSGNYAPAATLIIKADGSYSFSINAPVAHSTALPGIEEDKTLSFNFSVTDGDGDTASGKLNISVNDDTPVPVASIVTNWSVMDDEAQIEFTPTNTGWSLGDVDPNIKTVSGGAGALFTVGADGLGSIAITPPAFSVLYKDAQGFAQTESVSWGAGVRSADGTTTWTATSGNHAPAATLIIKADGSYSFTMNAPLAHSNGLLAENTDSLSFTYAITDGDGDQAGGVLTVLVNDDRPVSSSVTAATVLDDEAQTLFPGNNTPSDGVTNVATASGAAGSLFTMGADGLGTITIAPPAFSVISKDAQGFAQTEAVSWGAGVRGADGTTTWTATSANHTPAATLIIKADGSYSFTLNAPLAHQTVGTTEENRRLSFDFQVTDGDGDTASGTLRINVNDDAPTSMGVVTSSTVVDDEAQTLFPGNNTPSDGVANVATASGAAGSLFSMGSDGLGSVTITPPGFSVVSKDAQGFAQTEAVSWGAGVRGADGTTTWTATSTNHAPAATLIIKADGSYSFTLNAPLAHSGSGETNNELSFGFSVTDGDGDKVTGTLKVNVNDDAPNAVNTVNASRTLDDEAQTEFTPTNTGWTLGDTNPNYKSVSGGAGTLFSMGSDGLGSITVTPPAFSVIYKDTQGFAQTEAVTWDGGVRSADGTTTWTATSGNYAPAATLIIKADGSYSFSINAPVAHSTALPGIEEDKTLSFNFSVTDGDGDTASGKLNISVNDDTPVPVASIVTNWSVMDDEAQIEFTPTNTGWSLGDVDPNIKTVSGGAGALFTVGADGLGSIAITPPAFSVLYKDAQGFAQTESVSWSAGVRSADGTTTWTATSGNHAPAATLIIKADGSYSFTMNAPLAHSNGLLAENTDSLSFTYGITDGDGDQAGGVLTVLVNDDRPVSSSVTAATVLDDEAQTLFPGNNTPSDGVTNVATASGAAGSLFTMGADGLGTITIAPPAFSVISKDAQGFAQTEAVSWGAGVRGADGTTTWTATSANHTPAATLIIKADGSYSFTLNAPLAHQTVGTTEENRRLSFDFQVTDGDGDTASGTLRINVNDDAPTSMGVVTSSTVVDDEAQTLFPGNNTPSDGIANVATASGAAGSLFSMGSDGLGSVTITPPGFSVVSKDAQGFAQTEAVSWGAGVRGADGTTTWTATSTNHAPAATLIIKADGSYSFTLNAPLAHSGSGETNNELSFGFSVTDGDGDKVTGTLKVNVNDDAPVKAHDYRYVSVQEADLAVGPDTGSTVFENKMGADGLGGVEFTGQIKLNIGGGVAGNVSLDIAGGPVTVGQFTSDGKPITFVLVSDTLVRGYITPENGGGAGGTTVIEISLTGSDQGVATKLFGPIDHIAVVDGKPIDSILVDATVRFTDGDGDDITAIIRTTIVDDVPSTTQVDRYITLSENNIAAGLATGTRAFTIDFGSDGYGRTFFTGKMGLNIGGTVAGNVVFDVDAGPQVVTEITSGGKPITFEKVGDNLINGYIVNDAGQRIDVIRLELNDTDTDVIATLLRPIDHLDVGVPTPLGQIRIDATVGFADGDGDVVTSILRVNIDDSTPTLTSAGPDIGALTEVSLPQVSSTFGNLGVNVGADKNGHVAFAPGVVAALQAQALTSDDVALEYTIRDNGFGGEELVAYKAGSTADDPVFIIGVYRPASFAATLFQNVDHAANSDSLPLSLTARVYDGDGDYVDRAFTITVADDAPTLTAPVEDYNLLTNGDFSVGAWSPTSYGGASTGAIGWSINGTQPGQAGVQLEQVANGYLGMSSTSGHMVDLAASPGNVEISQTLSGLDPNASYTLSFEIGAPDPSSAGLEVYWNGVKLNAVFTITNQMTLVTLNGLEPDSMGRGVLTFKEVGSPDNTGTYLADVKLAPTAAPDLPLVEAQMGEDGTAVFNFSEGTDFDFGADGKGSVAFDANAAVITTPSGTLLDKPTISYDPVTGKLTIDPGWGFNGLSKNEIATLTIPFSVTDADGDVRTGLYRVTILGSDDPVTSSVGFPETGVITEYAEGHPLANSTGERTWFDNGYNGGGFWIYGDQGDTHTVTVVPVGAGQLGHITHEIGETTANDGAGFVNWKYNVTDQELNYLAAGQTKVEEFDIVVSDPYGNSTTRRITVTLVGSNDTPVITVAQGDSIASELIETNAGLQAAGTLSVSDVDVTDVVTASVGFIEISGPDYGTNLDHAMIRSFMTVNTPVVGNDQTTGTLNWSFNSNSQAFNFLPQGSRLVFKYTIVVTDSAGATDEQIVTVAINGTNDAPVISMPLAETTETIDGQLAVSRFINETDTGLSSSGTLTVSDVDNISAMTVQVVGVTGGGAGYNIANAANFLTISSTAPIYDAGETANNLSWSFNSGAENFNFLSQGTQIRLNYTIRVTDNFGASVDQVVTILINGTNDGPVVDLNGAAAGVDGATYAVEGQPRWAFDAATLSDVDSSNLKSMTVGFGNGRDPANANGETETLTLNTAAENARAAAGLVLSFNAITGALTISGNASVATYQTILRGIVYQNNNDTPSAQRVLEVSVTDDYNAVATAQMVVSVTAVNDAPQIPDQMAMTVVEGSTTVLSLSMFGFANVAALDPDSPATDIVFKVPASLPGVTFLNGGAPTLSFTVAELQAGLISVVHDGREDPSLTFTLSVDDANQDGSPADTAQLTINVTPVNDAPVAKDFVSNLVFAENSVTTNVVVPASDIVSDVDTPLSYFSASSVALGEVKIGNGAPISLSAAGISRALDGTITVDTTVAAYDYLRPGDSVDVVVKFTVTDDGGLSDEGTVTFNVTGTNDVPTFSGLATGTVHEDGNLAAAGTVAVTDPDLGESGFLPAATLAGSYGTFTFNEATGEWTYQLNNGNATVQALDAADDPLEDRLTIKSLDGTSHDIVVKIQGADEPVVSTPVTVNNTSAHYAFADGTPQPGTISIDLASLFGGGSSNMSYSFDTVRAGNGVTSSGQTLGSGQWDWLSRNGNTIVGDPPPNPNGSDNRNGMYVAKVSAHDLHTGITTVTYVAIMVLSSSGTAVVIPNNANVSVSQNWLDNAITLTDGQAITSQVNGGSGNDVLMGNAAANNLTGADANDALYGGGGNDTLDGGSQDDFVAGGSGDDIIYGRDGDDVLLGEAGNDTIWGGSQNDIIIGGDGNDILYGESGEDILFGGAGLNTMTGGSGNDTFVIDPSALTELNMVDVVTDYDFNGNRGFGNDTIDLSDVLNAALGHDASAAEAAAMIQKASDGAGGTIISIDTNGAAAGGVVDLVRLENYAHTNSIRILFDDDPTNQTINI